MRADEAERAADRLAPAESDELIVRTSEPARLRPVRRIRELLAYREVLANLTRKDVKVKYTSSVLGAAWSMLNPLLYLLVFTLVFEVVLKSGIPNFPIYLLSGLLAWNLFSGSLTLAARSVVENANLVKKVFFPREILPLASMGASLVDFGLQALVLAVFMLVERYSFFGANVALLPLSLLALLVWTAALSLWVGGLNVRYRDTQHLLNLALLTWFWFTPVVYPSGFLMWRAQQWTIAGIPLSGLYLALNPMADIIMGFQRSLYANLGCARVTVPSPHTQCILYPVSVGAQAVQLAIVAVGSVALLFLFWRVFFRQAGDFAEEL